MNLDLSKDNNGFVYIIGLTFFSVCLYWTPAWKWFVKCSAASSTGSDNTSGNDNNNGGNDGGDAKLVVRGKAHRKGKKKRKKYKFGKF